MTINLSWSTGVKSLLHALNWGFRLDPGSYNSGMEPSPLRLQLRLVAASYAVVVANVYQRYLKYVRNPQDAAASSGMYAGGDLLLA